MLVMASGAVVSLVNLVDVKMKRFRFDLSQVKNPSLIKKGLATLFWVQMEDEPEESKASNEAETIKPYQYDVYNKIYFRRPTILPRGQAATRLLFTMQYKDNFRDTTQDIVAVVGDGGGSPRGVEHAGVSNFDEDIPFPMSEAELTTFHTAESFARDLAKSFRARVQNDALDAFEAFMPVFSLKYTKPEAPPITPVDKKGKGKEKATVPQASNNYRPPQVTDEFDNPLVEEEEEEEHKQETRGNHVPVAQRDTEDDGVLKGSAALIDSDDEDYPTRNDSKAAVSYKDRIMHVVDRASESYHHHPRRFRNKTVQPVNQYKDHVDDGPYASLTHSTAQVELQHPRLPPNHTVDLSTTIKKFEQQAQKVDPHVDDSTRYYQYRLNGTQQQRQQRGYPRIPDQVYQSRVDRAFQLYKAELLAAGYAGCRSPLQAYHCGHDAQGRDLYFNGYGYYYGNGQPYLPADQTTQRAIQQVPRQVPQQAKPQSPIRYDGYEYDKGKQQTKTIYYDGYEYETNGQPYKPSQQSPVHSDGYAFDHHAQPYHPPPPPSPISHQGDGKSYWPAREEETFSLAGTEDEEDGGAVLYGIGLYSNGSQGPRSPDLPGGPPPRESFFFATPSPDVTQPRKAIREQKGPRVQLQLQQKKKKTHYSVHAPPGYPAETRHLPMPYGDPSLYTNQSIEGQSLFPSLYAESPDPYAGSVPSQQQQQKEGQSLKKKQHVGDNSDSSSSSIHKSSGQNTRDASSPNTSHTDSGGEQSSSYKEAGRCLDSLDILIDKLQQNVKAYHKALVEEKKQEAEKKKKGREVLP